MIFQQFGCISKELQESSHNFLHSSIVKAAATGVVRHCSQPLQELQNQQFRAVPLNGQCTGSQNLVSPRIFVSLHIPFIVNTYAHVG